MTTAVVFNFVCFSENICPICLANFPTENGKCVALVPLAETFNKKISNVLCKKYITLVKLLLQLRIVVKIVKMVKGLFAKYALGK